MKLKEKKKEACDKATQLIGKFTGVVVFALLAIFPLFFHRYYADILDAKYMFYYSSIIALSLAVVVIGGACVITDIRAKEYPAENLKKRLSRFSQKVKGCFQKITFPDAAMLTFLFICVISTFLSDYFYESFWGNEGRYTGLFLMLVYGAAFFIIGKFFHFKRWYLDVFLAAAVLVCLFGITDYFKMDILGFQARIAIKDYLGIFTSTFGNINTYTSYVGLVFGVATVLYVSEKDSWKVIFYYICMTVAAISLVTGRSDNGVLSFMVIFGFLPFYAFGTRRGIRRYAVLTATFLTVLLALHVVNAGAPGMTYGLDSMFGVIARFGKLPFVVCAMWAVALFICCLDRVKKKGDAKAGPAPIRVWRVLVAVTALAVIFMLYDANIAGNGDRYGALGEYLIINDRWGTYRGYIWRIAFEDYQKFPLMQKIFGHGLDTFGIITTNYNLDEMTNTYNQIFDSAHNEYIQYFVTIGPTGLVAYLAVIVSAGIRMVRRAADKPYVMAVFFACAAYGAQALVNINLPIVTPIMWTLLAMGLAGCRGGACEEIKKGVKK